MRQYAKELQDIAYRQTPIAWPCFKRCFDIGFSLCVLIFGLPLFIVLSAAIYLSSPGPVFYYASRIGLRGRIIRCVKFRSMYQNAGYKLQEIIALNPCLKLEWEKYKKLKKDPRITPIGKFLRKSSFDELPQFWNVLIGELSVVGPRPFYLEEILEFFGGKASTILSVKPGITGLWQTSGRSRLSIKERVELEEKYVKNHSHRTDLKLILKTIPAIFFSKGAY